MEESLDSERLAQETDELDEVFTKATQFVATKIAAKANSSDLLYLYGRYKQATEGPCACDRPSGWFDAKGKQKWDAWNGLKDLPKSQAMLEYIVKVEELDPEFETLKNSDVPIKGGQFGLSVSVMQNDEEPLPDDTKTIFDWTKEGNMLKIGRFLESVNELPLDENKISLLHWACDRGHLGAIKQILEKFPGEVNRRDDDGLTPLHYACDCDYPEVVRLLLDSGADPSMKDVDGNDCSAKVQTLTAGAS